MNANRFSGPSDYPTVSQPQQNSTHGPPATYTHRQHNVPTHTHIPQPSGLGETAPYAFSGTANASAGRGTVHGSNPSGHSSTFTAQPSLPQSPLSSSYRVHGSADSLYPSTLLPSRQLQAHHHPYQIDPQHSVRLLQSCDSCRRRKIRCSGEKPTCSSCIRYQEHCHYSPLATPRRRAGKRARTSLGNGTSGPSMLRNESAGRESSNEPLLMSSAASAHGDQTITGAEQSDRFAGNQETPSSGVERWHSEADEMRQDIHTLASKFDVLNNKLDTLIGLIGSRRRDFGRSETNESSSDYEDGESLARADTAPDGARSIVSESGEFLNLVDKTSRFGIDATNIGILADIMSSIDKARGQPQQTSSAGVRVSGTTNAGTSTPRPDSAATGLGPSDEMALPRRPDLIQQLLTSEMQEHLIDTFYLNTDVNTIAFIPRYIFDRLQHEKRAPVPMINVIMADACNYSNHEAVLAMGRHWARGYFIERAYRGLFACLEYDSTEHCVALLLFAMVISKAGLHRAWIMHSLSTQMAIRLRFNTLDSPLSSLAFKNDTMLTLEWKRRIFWQLYTFDILTSTLSDLPPCLSIHGVRCKAPQPLTDAAANGRTEDVHDLVMLGPAVVFCDDQSTLELQIELTGIMCDISTLQAKLTPEECLFPPEFTEMHRRLEDWQQRLPHFDVLAEGSLIRISEELKSEPGQIYLGLLFQYARILLCLIKDTWLPTKREMTAEEAKTLNWARNTAYESAQAVHRLVPFVRSMRLSIVCPFMSCVVFQACIVSLHSCAWNHEPRRILAAVNNVQRGLDFLEYVSPRWGFASVLTTSLRSLVVERGFGSKDFASEPKDTAEDQPMALDSDVDEPLPASMMRPFVEESQSERILRTGEMPHWLQNKEQGPAVHMCENAENSEGCFYFQPEQPPPRSTSFLGIPIPTKSTHDDSSINK
ncbi:hypothetical protein GGH12_003119 [Coemansia sp. RSA 1822]|nr:hypothetical protein LPJ76_003015 [Coemansia sp. RSA 638]KAJ2545820.1 hypothetical protein GGF49_000023 [Coemansia sp. RSA 1853]KAJ2562593.1 hypothetical protein GGH12_003119 [Coemansia sp. RSA 1822]